MENKTIINVPIIKEKLNEGDCKLAILSSLLKYYGFEYPISDILGFMGGLDFYVEKYADKSYTCFLVLGKRMGIEEEFLSKIGLTRTNRVFSLEDGENTENRVILKTKCKESMIKGLLNKDPIVVSADRFFLTYLLKHDSLRAHMPYHAILVVGYDSDIDSFYVLDALETGIQSVSAEELMSAMFETSPLKNEFHAEYYYVNQNSLEQINELDFADAMKKQITHYSTANGALDAFRNTIDFMKEIQHKTIRVNKEDYLVYLKYQILFLCRTIYHQDFSHKFYRGCYLNFFQNHALNIRGNGLVKKITNLLKEEINLWEELVTIKNDSRQYINCFEHILKKEEKGVIALNEYYSLYKK